MVRPKTALFSLVSSLGLGAVLAPSALAAVTFMYQATTVDTSGQLQPSWVEQGLTPGSTVSYLVEADAAARWGCVDRRGRITNEALVQQAVTAAASRVANPNGVINVGTFNPIPVAAPQPNSATLSCRAKQTLTLVAVSYTSVRASDLTNNVATVLPDAARTLFS